MTLTPQQFQHINGNILDLRWGIVADSLYIDHHGSHSGPTHSLPCTHPWSRSQARPPSHLAWTSLSSLTYTYISSWNYLQQMNTSIATEGAQWISRTQEGWTCTFVKPAQKGPSDLVMWNPDNLCNLLHPIKASFGAHVWPWWMVVSFGLV